MAGASVNVGLLGVSSTCNGLPYGTPCASRALFRCAIEGQPPSAPMRATLDEQRASGGELIALGVYVTCPVPTFDPSGGMLTGSYAITITHESYGVIPSDADGAGRITINQAPPPSPPPSSRFPSSTATSSLRLLPEMTAPPPRCSLASACLTCTSRTARALCR